MVDYSWHRIEKKVLRRLLRSWHQVYTWNAWNMDQNQYTFADHTFTLDSYSFRWERREMPKHSSWRSFKYGGSSSLIMIFHCIWWITRSKRFHRSTMTKLRSITTIFWVGLVVIWESTTTVQLSVCSHILSSNLSVEMSKNHIRVCKMHTACIGTILVIMIARPRKLRMLFRKLRRWSIEEIENQFHL